MEKLWKMDKIVEHNFPQFLHSIYTDGPHFSHTVSKCWILRKIAVDLDWPWIINYSQARPQLPKISQTISKMVCHRFSKKYFTQH